jgi:hypothetical protein
MLLMKSGKTDFRGGLQQASNELLTNLRPVSIIYWLLLLVDIAD